MIPGPRNLITDVAGLRVGNASDDKLKSGVTALLCDVDVTASVHVMGGAPGTRDTDLLAPDKTVTSVDAIVLSGGSAFGLDACGGVQAVLREAGRGFQIGPHRVPIVPGAILFDLINGGDKDWGAVSPYAELGRTAAQNASETFDLGTTGAGTGALTGGPGGGLKGGLGSASAVLANGITIAALVAVNALGSPLADADGHFWAAPFEKDGEFGGLGPSPAPSDTLHIKFRQAVEGANTTIGIIATDAVLTKAQANRLAVAAHDGFARALWPAHTPLDGDAIFTVATGGSGVTPDLDGQIDLSAAAGAVMARAIARGVYEATPTENDLFPVWSSLVRR